MIDVSRQDQVLLLTPLSRDTWSATEGFSTTLIDTYFRFLCNLQIITSVCLNWLDVTESIYSRLVILNGSAALLHLVCFIISATSPDTYC
jgi:hypothetical protein